MARRTAERTGHRLALASFVLAAFLASGCSTFLAQTHDSRVYGGVRFNRYLRAYASDGAWKRRLWIPFLWLDLPLSALADTALLPGTIPMELLSREPASIPGDEEFVVVVVSRPVGRSWLWWVRHYSIRYKRGDDDHGVHRLRRRRREPAPGVRLSKTTRLRRELDLERRRLHAVFTGERAKAIISEIRHHRRWHDRYRAWPGPNSNTRAAAKAHDISGLSFHMDHNACGKDYTPGVRLGRTTSATGLAFDTLPIGVAAGVIEGVEIHLLQLTFGISIFPPAIKVPFLQRLGFPARVDRD